MKFSVALAERCAPNTADFPNSSSSSRPTAASRLPMFRLNMCWPMICSNWFAWSSPSLMRSSPTRSKMLLVLWDFAAVLLGDFVDNSSAKSFRRLRILSALQKSKANLPQASIRTRVTALTLDPLLIDALVP